MELTPTLDETSTLKEEAKYLADRVRKQAAGRVYMSPDELEVACKRIEQYYEEKKAFEDLINAPRPKLNGCKASDRIPFL